MGFSISFFKSFQDVTSPSVKMEVTYVILREDLSYDSDKSDQGLVLQVIFMTCGGW